MGRFRDSALDSEPDTAIDISPLIDCVFILLIFFIVTTVFVEESGIDVTRPQAAATRRKISSAGLGRTACSVRSAKGGWARSGSPSRRSRSGDASR